MPRITLLALLALLTACSPTRSGGGSSDDDDDDSAADDDDSADDDDIADDDDDVADDDDDDATTTSPDADGDGYPVELDCDDEDPTINPGASEACDGVDNDCNGEIDNGFDADDDGWTSCAGDCVNSDPFINPDAEEQCDGIDNDCDCMDNPVDTNNDGLDCGPGDAGVDETFDGDGDGFIDANTPLCADIYGPNADYSAAGDCDDDESEVHPGAHEQSGDGMDNDCDTCTDECFDHDGDGWDNCDPGDGGDASCTDPGQGSSGDGLDADCNDSPADFLSVIVHPDIEFTAIQADGTPVVMDEQCDGLDNDCDGQIDEGWNEDCELIE